MTLDHGQGSAIEAASLKIVGLGLLGLTCPRPTGPTGPRPTMTGSFLAFPLFVSVAGISHVAGIASVGWAWLGLSVRPATARLKRRQLAG